MDNETRNGTWDDEPRRKLMLRIPMELYQWLHRTSVKERRTKTAILSEAVAWAQALSDRASLKLIELSEGPRRTTSFDFPEPVYLWLRIEAAVEGWSSNELALRVLTAWRSTTITRNNQR